jgi:hypothetical protein
MLTKTQTVADQYYDLTGSPLVLGNALSSFTDPNYYDKSYQMGPLSSWGKIQSFFMNNPSDFTFNSDRTHQRDDPNNYDTTNAFMPST